MRVFDCVRIMSIIAAIALGGALACKKSDPIQPNPQRAVLSRTSVLDLDGSPFDLQQHTSGHISVVVFTRTDCPISNRFAPEIRRLYETYHTRGVDFFLIYVDPQEDPDSIRRHLREYQYSCPGLRDPKHALVKYCNVTITPEAAVLNADQSIAYVGRINDLYAELGQARTEPTTHDLADAIESTVVGRPVTTPRTKAVGCVIADVAE